MAEEGSKEKKMEVEDESLQGGQQDDSTALDTVPAVLHARLVLPDQLPEESVDASIDEMLIVADQKDSLELEVPNEVTLLKEDKEFRKATRAAALAPGVLRELVSIPEVRDYFGINLGEPEAATIRMGVKIRQYILNSKENFKLAMSVIEDLKEIWKQLKGNLKNIWKGLGGRLDKFGHLVEENIKMFIVLLIWIVKRSLEHMGLQFPSTAGSSSS